MKTKSYVSLYYMNAYFLLDYFTFPLNIIANWRCKCFVESIQLCEVHYTTGSWIWVIPKTTTITPLSQRYLYSFSLDPMSSLYTLWIKQDLRQSPNLCYHNKGLNKEKYRLWKSKTKFRFWSLAGNFVNMVVTVSGMTKSTAVSMISLSNVGASLESCESNYYWW